MSTFVIFLNTSTAFEDLDLATVVLPETSIETEWFGTIGSVHNSLGYSSPVFPRDSCQLTSNADLTGLDVLLEADPDFDETNPEYLAFCMTEDDLF
jgi:hypothetical protein